MKQAVPNTQPNPASPKGAPDWAEYWVRRASSAGLFMCTVSPFTFFRFRKVHCMHAVQVRVWFDKCRKLLQIWLYIILITMKGQPSQKIHVCC